MDKRIASTLIFLSAASLAAVSFIEKNNPSITHITEWAKAFFEASLIGGLADWFAVTALFRHPFSLPIPHTKIIPKEKLRIGKVLSQFLKSTFLTEEGISREFTEERMRALAIKSITLKDETSTLLQNIFKEVLASTSNEVLKKFESAETKEACLDVFLSFVLSRSSHLKLILKEKLPLPWYVPQFMKQKVSETILDSLIDSIKEASLNKHDPLRAELTYFLVTAVEKIKSSDFVKSSALKSFNVIQFIKESVIDSNILYVPIKNLLISLLPLFHSTLDTVIERTFSSFNDQEIVEKIEGALIHDLQWIRINGTLVGGLLGVLFHGIKTFF